MCKALFQCWLELLKISLWGSLWEVPGEPKIDPGVFRGRPGDGQAGPKIGSGGEEVPKSVQEASWSHLGTPQESMIPFFREGLGSPGAAFGELWGVLEALF